MTAATASPRRLIRTALKERRVMGGRVDRERGIVRGVKIVGRSSPNTHGVRGVDGTVYTQEALDDAAPLYEGVNVNVDHPPRQKPDVERSARDRFAWLENVHVAEGGLYGDLCFLDPRDPLAVKILNAAERHPEAFALSHNAIGKGEVRDGKYVVTEIPEVRSVDIVSDGGTNRSLFEGRVMRVRVSEVLRDRVRPSLRRGLQERLDRLLGRVPDTLLMEAASGEDHVDHLYKAMRSAQESGHDDVAKGVHKLMHPDNHPDKKDVEEEQEPEEEKEEEEEDEDEETEEEPEEPVEEGMGEEGPGEPGAHNQGPDGPGGTATAWESRRRKKTRRAPGVVRLSESQARKMCKTSGLEATTDLLEAIKGASFDQALRVIEIAKRTQTPPRYSSPPRSAGRGVTLQESALPAATDAKGWATRLLS